MNKLAIIIPAYKIDFFEETMKSIVDQTNHDFSVYIGIDASPYDFETIIKKYTDRLDITYRRFEENLGGKDLVGQWKRCVEMAREEEWLWLFSDDDIMHPHCVEDFYETLRKTETERKNCYVYHFDVVVINEKSQTVKNPSKYPKQISAIDYYYCKMWNRLDSFVVENVFSRARYNEVGGFVSFDYAWGADTASWISFMGNVPMRTIKGDSQILWRQSDKNITPNNSHDLALRKVKATMNFFDWSMCFFQNVKGFKCYNLLLIIQRLSYYSRFLGKKEVQDNTINVLLKYYSCVDAIFFIIFFVAKIKNTYRNVGV